MINVVYFGTEDISVPTLQALIDDDKYNVVGVVTKPDSARGRGHHVDSPAVAKLAQQHNITCLQPSKLRDVTELLGSLQADVGALVSYGKIIPQDVIDIFPHGIVNFHPSMLPVYRGPSPIETAIMHGDSFTGLTLMALSKDMDAGDIYYQEKVAIGPDDTAEQLCDRFGRRGAELMVEKLGQIVAGQLTGTPQDNDLAIYCHMITKADGQLDPGVMTARQCYNRWRALSRWPKCRLNLDGDEVIVTKLKPLDNFQGDNWPDVIPCQDDSAIQILEIINPKSGRRMSVTDYLNGLHK